MVKQLNSNLSIVIVLMAMLICISACRHDVKLRADAVLDRAAIPVLEADSVTTLVSDSGITRYRITTPKWQIYDMANPPYWEFVQGVYLEKFDEDLHVDAMLEADYAYYDENAQIWHLTGNVHSHNLKGEEFFTPELYWNQKTERVYSDSTITIVRETSTIMGVGFESNQDMSQYTILHPTGYFPLKDE